MLSPKRTKYRKMQKGNNRGIAWRGCSVSFGDFGLQCLEPGRLTLASDRSGAYGHHPPREARRQALDPDLPRPPGHQEAARGAHGWRQRRAPRSGPRSWSRAASCTRSAGVTEDVAREAFRLATHKLPVATRVLVRGIF